MSQSQQAKEMNIFHRKKKKKKGKGLQQTLNWVSPEICAHTILEPVGILNHSTGNSESDTSKPCWSWNEPTWFYGEKIRKAEESQILMPSSSAFPVYWAPESCSEIGSQSPVQRSADTRLSVTWTQQHARGTSTSLLTHCTAMKTADSKQTPPPSAQNTSIASTVRVGLAGTLWLRLSMV